MITLILTRHGQTNWNRAGKLAGSTDLPKLTKEGKKQAEKLAQKLNDWQIGYIYSSNLMRAKQTASIIAKKLEGKIIIASEFNERSWGIYEGNDWETQRQNLGELFEGNSLDARPQGGETYREFLERIEKGIKRVIKKHEGQVVLIVSHGGVLRGLLRHFLKKELESGSINNTSISVVKVENGRVLEVMVNDIGHLDEIDTRKIRHYTQEQ